MNVFLVTEDLESDRTILGIFSKFELAQAEINRQKGNRKFEKVQKCGDSQWLYSTVGCSYGNLEISKIKIDKGSHCG
jgi:hypothetical protein